MALTKKRFLIAIDPASDSGAVLRFTLQVASRPEVALTFLNVHNVLSPITWRKEQYGSYEQRELAQAQRRLEQFVEDARQQLGETTTELTCVVINSPFVDRAIRSYAEEHQFDYICVGTRGPGAVEKLTGTTTSTLINQSAVPVITVPAGYRPSPVRHVLYASDLTNVEPELSQVVNVARPLGATVDLVHILGPTKPEFDCDTLPATIRQFTDYPVQVYLEPAIPEQNLSANLEQVIQRLQPSLLIMFSKHREGFVQRLFSTSYSARYAFYGSLPLLVFTKP